MTERLPSRRSLLTGRALSEATADAVQSTGNATPEPAASTDPTYLLHVTRRAMACEFTIYLNAGQYPSAPESAVRALDLVMELEDQMTVYQEHSEISRINRTAAAEPVAVEPQLCELLMQGLRLHQQTGGAFDMTAGPLSTIWGFRRREARMPSASEIETALGKVGSQHVAIDPQQNTVQFLRPDVELNLGAIGKGYALDRCRQLLLAEDVGDFLIHGGHSSVLGCGSRSGRDKAGWRVDIRHPLRPDRILAEIQLHNRALATSGSAMQGFNIQGRRYGHILDPRTGWPANRVLSATVLTRDAAQADALATAFYVDGIEAARRFCQSDEAVSAILICGGKKSGHIEVHTFRMQSVDWVCHESMTEVD